MIADSYALDIKAHKLSHGIEKKYLHKIILILLKDLFYVMSASAWMHVHKPLTSLVPSELESPTDTSHHVRARK